MLRRGGFTLDAPPPSQWVTPFPETEVDCDTTYKKWEFPDDDPWPYANALGYCGVHKAKTWKDTPATPPNIRGLRKYRRRCLYYGTCCGLGILAVVFLTGIMGTAVALLLAQVWVEFLHDHAANLFNNGIAELPNVWNDFAEAVAITAACGFIGASVITIDWVYHTQCRHRKRRMNRQGFNSLNEKARVHDKYMYAFDWEYDSDKEPVQSYKFFRQHDLFDATRNVVEIHSADNDKVVDCKDLNEIYDKEQCKAIVNARRQIIEEEKASGGPQFFTKKRKRQKLEKVI